MSEKETTMSIAADYIAAYDERTRLFNELRHPKKTEEEIESTLTAYILASKNFDMLRAKLLKGS